MRSMLLISLITSLFACSHAPLPPPMAKCLNLSDQGIFRCRSSSGVYYSVKFEEAKRMICISPEDWEARQNWEAAVQ